MLLVQEDVNQKTVAISVKATKLTGRLLRKAIAAALRKIGTPQADGSTIVQANGEFGKK